MTSKASALAHTKWGVGAIIAAAAALIFMLAGSGASRPARPSAASICTNSAYTPGQPIEIAAIDGSASTTGSALRSEYAAALDSVASTAASRGAYLIVNTFGSSVGTIKTLCATSTRIAAAAPIFATAQKTELTNILAQIAARASHTQTGNGGSSIYGALVDSVQRVHELRNASAAPARITIITDGDEAAGGVHLRVLLDAGDSDAEIAQRIVGKLPLPTAAGIAIQIEGIARFGTGRAISTTGSRRMEAIWSRICSETAAQSCSATSDINTSL